MKPKQKAKEILDEITGDVLLFTGGEEVHQKSFAKRLARNSIDLLINEHTYKNPISWNVDRKKYWEQVKKEIELL